MSFRRFPLLLPVQATPAVQPVMLLGRVRQFVRQHALFRGDTRLLVALSGGSDSVALAALLRELDVAGDVRLIGALHFNHQLRETADRDEQFSAHVAQSLDLPFVVDRGDVLARARRERRSLEGAAREARYEFFERARLACGADLVALGHTRDDQAETVLLRLMRGAGPRGLAAMYPRRGTIVRPVPDCRRQQLRAFLEERRMAYVDDETNRDLGIPRNRVRADLLPLMAEHFNPAIVDALAREAELAREIWAWLESEAARFEDPQPEIDRGEAASFSLTLNVDRLKQAPLPLRRLVVWRAMNEAAGGRTVSFRHVDAALELVNTDRPGLDAPGHRVQRLGPGLVLTGRPRETVGRWSPPAILFRYPLSIPGEVELVEAECVVSVDLIAGQDVGNALTRSGHGFAALVRRDVCSGSLAVRNRRPGDSFRPVGLGGRRKLQDYFVDRKVVRAGRGRVPLVVDETDRIVWVAGYGIDEAFRVTDPSQSMLLLRLKLLGGRA